MLDVITLFINESRIISGLLSFIMNFGGRYVMLEIPQGADSILGHPISRKIILFCFSYLATRELKSAILITLFFLVVFKYLFNEKSKAYVGKAYVGKKEEENKNVTAEELERAKKIIKSYNKQLENAKIDI